MPEDWVWQTTLFFLVQATNDHNASAFIACVDADAIVNDAGRQFHGTTAIKAWSDREIMEPKVTLDVFDVRGHDEEITITTKVDGNFDRTGLPDPVIIDQTIDISNGKIARLTCRLVPEPLKNEEQGT